MENREKVLAVYVFYLLSSVYFNECVNGYA